MPLEHHQPGPYVDLLDDRVPDDRVPLSADRLEAVPDRFRSDDVRGPRGRHHEFVLVHVVAVAGEHLLHEVVPAVEQQAVSASLPIGDLPLPPGEDRLSEVVLDPEVVRAQRRVEGMEPDQMALRIANHRAVLSRAGLRREEDVVARRERQAPRDREPRWTQVGATPEALHAGWRAAGIEARRTRDVLAIVRPERGEDPEADGAAAVRAREFGLAPDG